MISASAEYKRLVSLNPADNLVKATLTLADNTVLNLAGDDFMEGGFSFDQATSTDSAFDIGAAVMGSFSCTLNNTDGKFDEYDFTGAEIVPYVGRQLENGQEWVLKGYYEVAQPDSYGNTIALSCIDNMRLLERPYTDVITAYPADLYTIVSNICTVCGLTLSTLAFPNHSYTVSNRPTEENLTCLQVLAYAAQIACCWANVDNQGRLQLKWYDTSWRSGGTWLDGGTYLTDTTPYSDGDTADGGSFHSGGATADGGTFSPRSYALLTSIHDLSVCTDDVVITGVDVTAYPNDAGEGESYLDGAAGYVLAISGNPLIVRGQAQTVAGLIDPHVVGMRFRPFDSTVDGDPTIEPGDPVFLVDGKGREYYSYATHLQWQVSGTSQVSCTAETPSRNSADSFSAVTAAIVANRKGLRVERTARETAIQNLQNQLANSSGLYMTQSVQPDQSIIYYLHDKPTLAESTIVWKFTATTFAVSVDGGVTYPFGFDAWGNAILNSIYAIGIDADYITGGTIASRAGDSTWNLTTGEFSIGGVLDTVLTESSITVGSSARSAGTMTARVGMNYYICFSSTAANLTGYRMSIADSTNFNTSTSGSPEYVGEVTSGTNRFFVRVKVTEQTANRDFSGSISIGGGSSSNTVTFTDVRVYEEPNRSDGMISIDSHSLDEADEVRAVLTGGTIEVSRNEHITSIAPGAIDLDANNLGNNDGRLMLSQFYGLDYDAKNGRAVFGRSPKNPGVINDAAVIASGNTLATYGYLASDGPYYSTTTVSEIATAYSGFSISSASMRRRGKLVAVNITGSLTSSWTVKGNGMSQGSKQLLTLVVKPVRDFLAMGRLSREYVSSSWVGIDSYAMLSVAASNGYLYAYAVAPQNSNFNTTATVPSGQSVTIELIYFCS